MRETASSAPKGFLPTRPPRPAYGAGTIAGSRTAGYLGGLPCTAKRPLNRRESVCVLRSLRQIFPDVQRHARESGSMARAGNQKSMTSRFTFGAEMTSPWMSHPRPSARARFAPGYRSVILPGAGPVKATSIVLPDSERALSLQGVPPAIKLIRQSRMSVPPKSPSGWRHWAEVVWSESWAPEYIGDMPHTWIGAEFFTAVRVVRRHARRNVSVTRRRAE